MAAADPTREDLNFTINHAKDVTIAVALRELITNAADADNGKMPESKVLSESGDSTLVTITDKGRGLTRDAFVFGGGDQRNGRHGLGLKDALAVLLRRGVIVTIASAGHDFSFDIEGPQERVFLIRTAAREGSWASGTKFTLVGVPDAEKNLNEAKAHFFDPSKFEAIAPTVAGVTAYYRGGAGSEVKGGVFVNRLRVGNFPTTWTYTIDDAEIEGKLSRDHTAAHYKATRRKMMKMIRSYLNACGHDVLESLPSKAPERTWTFKTLKKLKKLSDEVA